MDAAARARRARHVGRQPKNARYQLQASQRRGTETRFRGARRASCPSGKIGIFNRSYYEEVLIARVHPEILHAEGLPPGLLEEDAIWHDRYRSIVGLERHLDCNGTKIIKFCLHLSKEEQRKRFLERIDKPEKNWKFSTADIEERKFWKQYMTAYEKCLSATSLDYAPWYVVPADDKPNARLIVSRILVDTLQALQLDYPKPTAAHRRELRALRKQLQDRS